MNPTTPTTMPTTTALETVKVRGWKKMPFLRWSFLKMAVTMKKQLLVKWQVGDGREEKVAQHVLATARPGDLADAIQAIDRFAYDKSFLINVGDEKGAILDAAVKRSRPRRARLAGAGPTRSNHARSPGSVRRRRADRRRAR